jgi:flagellar hook assembly protein FlgD
MTRSIAGTVTLAIYDLTGRVIATLEEGAKSAGKHTARWNGRDQRGSAAASGVYFYRLNVKGAEGKNFTMTKKMTLLR